MEDCPSFDGHRIYFAPLQSVQVLLESHIIKLHVESGHHHVKNHLKINILPRYFPYNWSPDLLLCQHHIELFNLYCKILRYLLDLALDIVLEAPPLASVFHHHSVR